MFDFLKNKKEEQEEVSTSILPAEIMRGEALELKDIIAPSALKITQNEFNLG